MTPDGELTSSDTTTTEVVSRDRYRSETDVGYRAATERIANHKKFEVIVFDGKYYRRFDDLPWDVMSQPPPASSVDVDSDDCSGTSTKKFGWAVGTEARLLKRTTLQNQDVTIYEVSRSVTEKGTGVVTVVDNFTFWISDDGKLLKKIEMRANPVGKSFMRSDITYEYGDIQIQEPIISKTKTANK